MHISIRIVINDNIASFERDIRVCIGMGSSVSSHVYHTAFIIWVNSILAFITRKWISTRLPFKHKSWYQKPEIRYSWKGWNVIVYIIHQSIDLISTNLKDLSKLFVARCTQNSLESILNHDCLIPIILGIKLIRLIIRLIVCWQIRSDTKKNRIISKML